MIICSSEDNVPRSPVGSGSRINVILRLKKKHEEKFMETGKTSNFFPDRSVAATLNFLRNANLTGLR